MKFAYQQYTAAASPLHPSGVFFRPEVPIFASGPGGVRAYTALIDTGAESCLMPVTQAAGLGIDLQAAQQQTATGVTGNPVTVAVATVTFELAQPGESYRWSTPVAFATLSFPASDLVILGHAGALEYFVATFDGHAHEVDLVPAAGFPGTVR